MSGVFTGEEEKPEMGAPREKAVRGHSRKAASCKLRTEASEETRSAHTLMLDFQPLQP